MLAGLSFGEAKEMLKSGGTQVIGTQVGISMGTLRSMQILCWVKPICQCLYRSSLATISHGLIGTGGLQILHRCEISSLSEVKRSALDLYQLLIKGDMSVMCVFDLAT